MQQHDSLANSFLRHVPNQLAQLEYGMSDTEELAEALEANPRRSTPEMEIRRAVALADRSVRVWAAEAVGTTKQDDLMAEWTTQLHEARTPEEAGRMGDELAALGSSVHDYARLAVQLARQTCEAARGITDDIPGADNQEEFAQVVENGAATLAARARAVHDEDEAIAIAIETADWLATIRPSSPDPT